MSVEDVDHEQAGDVRDDGVERYDEQDRRAAAAARGRAGAPHAAQVDALWARVQSPEAAAALFGLMQGALQPKPQLGKLKKQLAKFVEDENERTAMLEAKEWMTHEDVEYFVALARERYAGELDELCACLVETCSLVECSKLHFGLEEFVLRGHQNLPVVQALFRVQQQLDRLIKKQAAAGADVDRVRELAPLLLLVDPAQLQAHREPELAKQRDSNLEELIKELSMSRFYQVFKTVQQYQSLVRETLEHKSFAAAQDASGKAGKAAVAVEVEAERVLLKRKRRFARSFKDLGLPADSPLIDYLRSDFPLLTPEMLLDAWKKYGHDKEAPTLSVDDDGEQKEEGGMSISDAGELGRLLETAIKEQAEADASPTESSLFGSAFHSPQATEKFCQHLASKLRPHEWHKLLRSLKQIQNSRWARSTTEPNLRKTPLPQSVRESMEAHGEPLIMQLREHVRHLTVSMLKECRRADIEYGVHPYVAAFARDDAEVELSRDLVRMGGHALPSKWSSSDEDSETPEGVDTPSKVDSLLKLSDLFHIGTDPVSAAELTGEELDERRIVYVSNMDPNASARDVFHAFQGCGKVRGVELHKDKVMNLRDRSSKTAVTTSFRPLREPTRYESRRHHKMTAGTEDALSWCPTYAFVHFEDEHGAMQALSPDMQLFGVVIQGRACLTQPAAQQTQLIVHNVSPSKHINELRFFLSEIFYNELPNRGCMLGLTPSSHDTKKHHEYVTAVFDTYLSAASAYRMLSRGVQLHGNRLGVSWAHVTQPTFTTRAVDAGIFRDGQPLPY